MMTNAFKDSDIRIGTRYWTDGQLFNCRRLQAKIKVMTDIIRDFLFAYHCDLNTGLETDWQHSIDDKFNHYWLHKTLASPWAQRRLKYCLSLPWVNHALSLTSKSTARDWTWWPSLPILTALSRNATIQSSWDKQNTAKASTTCDRLHTNLWNTRGISPQRKLKLYMARVLPTLLYACGTWTVYQSHAKKLNHFHRTCLMKLLNIKSQYRILDTDVLVYTGLPNISSTLSQSSPSYDGWSCSSHARLTAVQKNTTLSYSQK